MGFNCYFTKRSLCFTICFSRFAEEECINLIASMIFYFAIKHISLETRSKTYLSCTLLLPFLHLTGQRSTSIFYKLFLLCLVILNTMNPELVIPACLCWLMHGIQYFTKVKIASCLLMTTIIYLVNTAAPSMLNGCFCF